MRYDMNNEFVIRNFVEKRRLFRKISLLNIIGMVFYRMIVNTFFPLGEFGTYSRAYSLGLVIWFIFGAVLSRYIGYNLSICPVCHIVIPTVTPRHGRRNGRKVMGNGPLPDECPYCGTVFKGY